MLSLKCPWMCSLPLTPCSAGLSDHAYLLCQSHICWPSKQQHNRTLSSYLHLSSLDTLECLKGTRLLLPLVQRLTPEICLTGHRNRCSRPDWHRRWQCRHSRGRRPGSHGRPDRRHRPAGHGAEVRRRKHRFPQPQCFSCYKNSIIHMKHLPPGKCNELQGGY